MPWQIGIQEVKLVGSTTGDLTVDIYQNGFSSTPSASGTKITGNTPPSFTNSQRSSDSVLDGWTTSILGGEWLTFDVTGSSTVQQATLSISGRRLNMLR